MGMREELQADIAEAFNTDLADAVQQFTGSYTGPGKWDPVTETNTGQKITYSGRGVIDNYADDLIDGLNIKVGDMMLLCLVNEVTGTPAAGHKITAKSLMSGADVEYTVIKPGIDPVGAHYEMQLRTA